MKTCKLCEKPVKGLGLCPAHYEKQRRERKRATKVRCAMGGNCYREEFALGLCALHFSRWLLYRDPWFDGEHYVECEVEGCHRRRVGRGVIHFCKTHYSRQRQYGDPIAGQIDSPLGVDLPLAPLENALETRGGIGAAMYAIGLRENDIERARWEKSLARCRERGAVDVAVADRFAVKLFGTHPAMIWGEDWWVAGLEQDVAA